MAELRYQVVIDGTDTAGDYSETNTSEDTGPVFVQDLTSVARVQVNVPKNGVVVTLATNLDRGGVEAYSFVAITSPSTFLVGKDTAAGAERWAVAAGGWFMCHCNDTQSDLTLRNDSQSDIVATAYFGGTVT